MTSRIRSESTRSQGETPGDLSTAIIEDWSGFTGLEKEWDELLTSTDADTIFLSWPWLKSWSDVVGDSVRPFVITVRDADDRLVGAAPFYLSAMRALGVVSYRTLRIMADEGTGGEYPDWILRRGHEKAAADAIVVALKKARRRWDCIWMPRMAGWTGAGDRIGQACERAGFYVHQRVREFAAVKLPPTYPAYVSSLSPNKRQNLQTETRRIQRRKGVTITRCTSVEQIEPMLDDLFDLHHRRWNKRGQDGGFVHRPNMVRFYRQFAPAALQQGWLQLFALEEGGQRKAVQIGYVYDRVFLQLQEGFDPEYVTGAGNVLRGKVIEAAIADGVTTYDFLGDMSEHKRRWLAVVRHGFDLLIGHRSLKNRALFFKEVWPTGRYLRPVDHS